MGGNLVTTLSRGMEKWGYQRGSVYVGGEKVPVQKPRLRRNRKEKELPIYENLRDKNRFSEEIFQKTLMGISTAMGRIEPFGSRQKVPNCPSVLVNKRSKKQNKGPSKEEG